MDVQKYAEKDIRTYLHSKGKCFIAFSRRHLNTKTSTTSLPKLNIPQVQPMFKRGDHIEAIVPGRGFEKATVLGIFTSKKGKFEGRLMYFLKILCGTASIPVSAQDCYQLRKTPQL